MKRASLQILHCKAPRQESGHLGTWYAEYDGIFTVREFLLTGTNTVLVAPYDCSIHDRKDPWHLPDIPGLVRIPLAEFEELWEQQAQAHLNELAASTRSETFEPLHYFLSPFPAVFKSCGEGSSRLYSEYVSDISRRHFEVRDDDAAAVAPFDIGTPEVDGTVVLRAAREGADEVGEPIDPRLRPVEISHAEFEELWERSALPRLRMLASTDGESLP